MGFAQTLAPEDRRQCSTSSRSFWYGRLETRKRMPLAYRSACVLATLTVTLMTSCGKKKETPAAATTEKMTVVASDVAPCLNGLRPTKEPMAVLRKGDLIYVRGEPKGHLVWKEKVDGVVTTRDSDMILFSRWPSTEELYVFTKDLGETIDVPNVATFCDAIQKSGAKWQRYECKNALQRHRTASGKFVGYIVCTEGQCPVALHHEGQTQVITIDGLLDLRSYIVDGQTIFLATKRFSKNEGTWTGGAIVPIDFSGATPKTLPEIPLDEVDARDVAIVRTRTVQTELRGKTMRVFGDKAETERASGVVKSKEAFDETHQLLPVTL